MFDIGLTVFQSPHPLGAEGLLVKNERKVLWNRVAPVLPVVRAFAAICRWNFRRVPTYIFIGGILKYGAILAMSSMFFVNMSTGMAETMALVIGVVAISLVFSMPKRRKEGMTNESG